jgi:hypothetical protein
VIIEFLWLKRGTCGRVSILVAERKLISQLYTHLSSGVGIIVPLAAGVPSGLYTTPPHKNK